MRKETDLARVKMIAHVLLDMPIAETSFSPAIVSHPFTSTGVTAAQNEDGNITVVDLLNNKEDYAKWKEMVGKQIDSAENACQVFFLLTVFACAVPPGRGITKAICMSTTCASKRWPGRTSWWAE